MEAFKRWATLVDRHADKILWGLMGFVFFALTAFGVWKYTVYAYNVLDLAIFNQVFFSSAAGDLFGYTIHQHSYLGDHLAFTLPLLVPIYAIFQHPLFLVVVQTLWLILAAFPLYKLSQRVLSNNGSLLVASLYLLSPFIHSMALFEFHMLTLAIPLIFWMMLAYERKRLLTYLTLLILLVLTREDIALTVLFFAAIPLLERRSRIWWLSPIVLGGGWFLAAMKLSPYLSGYDSYKFSIYYGWLGSTLGEVIHNTIFNLNTIFAHVFRPDNFLYAVALIASFSFFPLLKSRYLIPTIPIFAQSLLSEAATGKMALIRHYPAIIVAWLFISLLFALSLIQKPNQKSGGRVVRFLRGEPGLAIFLLVTISLYAFFTLSPFSETIFALVTGQSSTTSQRSVHDDFLPMISPDANVISTDSTITQLSSRDVVYAFFYVWVGKQQFSDNPFIIEHPIDTLYIDSTQIRELFHHQVLNGDEKTFAQGDNKIRDVISEHNLHPTAIREHVIMFSKKGASEKKPFQTYSTVPEIEHESSSQIYPEIQFLGWSEIADHGFGFFFRPEKTITDYPFLLIEPKDTTGNVLRESIYTPAYGIYPAPEWTPGEVVQLNYWLDLPEETNHLSISFIDITGGYLQITETRSFGINYESWEIPEESIKIEVRKKPD